MTSELLQSKPGRADLHVRLHEIERQLLGVKRLLAEDKRELPSAPFHALEIPLGGQSYLVPVEPVREVVQAVWPSALPESPPWVLGTFRYGPLLLPMIDLAGRLFGRRTRLTPDLVVIILERPKRVGVLAPLPDSVIEVHPGALSPPDPEISQSPWIVGTFSEHSEAGAHLLSVERLGREFVLADA
ncbi:MAG: chemotaxis protein CheW [Polyangiaceae bacterium]|nr:chemotaxis protein CheW [Polyangiaceae bacterium]